MTQQRETQNERQAGRLEPRPDGSVDIVTDIGFGPRGTYGEDPVYHDGEESGLLATLWRTLRAKPGKE